MAGILGLDCVQHLYKKTGWNLVDWLVVDWLVGRLVWPLRSLWIHNAQSYEIDIIYYKIHSNVLYD